MKKTLLLFLFLLPFFGISQTDLVKWNGPGTDVPVVSNTTAITGGKIVAGSGSNLQVLTNEGFRTSGWTTNFAIDATKYVQVSVTANTGYKLKLNSFNFTYYGESHVDVLRYQVRYSKDDFQTSFVLLDEATTTGKVNKQLSLANITVTAGETLKIRIYGYKLMVYGDLGAPIFLANSNTLTQPGNTVPTITGNVLPYNASDINANDDNFSTKKNTAITIKALSNDTAGTSAISTVTTTQPASGQGSVSINPDRSFTFNPGNNFTGPTSFTYTISNSTKSSTGTVFINVDPVTSSRIIWNGASQQPVAAVSDPNITASNISATGMSFSSTNNLFRVNSIPTARDYGKYIEVSVAPKEGYKFDLTQFRFTYYSPSNGDSGPKKYEVRYSTDVSFPSNGIALTPQTNSVLDAQITASANFPAGVVATQSKPVYIRIYVYDNSQYYTDYHLIHDNGGELGPTIEGILSGDALTANYDTATTNVNQPVTISVLNNDIRGNLPLQPITISSQSPNGTATVNGEDIIFTPANNFIGQTSFVYSLSNGSAYSSATVFVTVNCQAPGNQTDFGQNQWTGYVYKLASNAAIPPNINYPALPSSTIATYIGRVTENKNFDRDMGDGAVSGLTTEIPCEAAPTDRFFVRYKMLVNITEAGAYRFDLGSDDGIKFYINNTEVVKSWGNRGYATNTYTQNLNVGQYEFVLEYYEDGGDARNSFFFGLPKGNPTEYGDKVWNVYGYANNDITLQNVRYAGYYVDPNLNPYSTSYWTKDKSPSSAAIWQGVQIPNDNFTVVYKRKGFDCGRYLLQHVNHDDAIEIYIDGVLIFSANGWNNASFPINNGQLYALNSESKVEIRLREDGGDANMGINFDKTNVTYTNGSGNEAGSNLVVNGTASLNSNLTVCSCTVNANSTFTVQKDATLTVDEKINVGANGKLLVLDGGSLLQTSTSTTMFTANATGSFEIQRKAMISRYDLTYWGVPVTNADLTMKKFSPNTLIDKYFVLEPSNASWVENYNGTFPMVAGKGYSIRAPQEFPSPAKQEFIGKFEGTPNNGDISVNVVSGKWNLIGNPYPSAIDADTFMDDNPGIGALYFWAHVNLPVKSSTDQFYYYTDDFVVYNGLGGINTGDANYFKGSIGAAQGFIVKAPAATINFNNGQREKAKNTQFYKTAKSDIEKNRVWLNLTNTTGTFKQILVGYATGATNGIDSKFDALSMNSNPSIDFYSIGTAKKLTIQGRALPFENSDVVPLGYLISTKGDYTISIDHADGLFSEGQDVFLEDKTLGKITNLRLDNYTFNSTAGTFNNRFAIRYTNKTLGTDDFENLENGVLVSIKSKIITINSATENISEVQIYNIAGQTVYTKNKIDSNELQIANLQSGNQVLLVKVILENGAAVTKKIIFN